MYELKRGGSGNFEGRKARLRKGLHSTLRVEILPDFLPSHCFGCSAQSSPLPPCENGNFEHFKHAYLDVALSEDVWLKLPNETIVKALSAIPSFKVVRIDKLQGAIQSISQRRMEDQRVRPVHVLLPCGRRVHFCARDVCGWHPPHQELRGGNAVDCRSHFGKVRR